MPLWGNSTVHSGIRFEYNYPAIPLWLDGHTSQVSVKFNPLSPQIRHLNKLMFKAPVGGLPTPFQLSGQLTPGDETNTTFVLNNLYIIRNIHNNGAQLELVLEHTSSEDQSRYCLVFLPIEVTNDTMKLTYTADRTSLTYLLSWIQQWAVDDVTIPQFSNLLDIQSIVNQCSVSSDEWNVKTYLRTSGGKTYHNLLFKQPYYIDAAKFTSAAQAANLFLPSNESNPQLTLYTPETNLYDATMVNNPMLWNNNNNANNAHLNPNQFSVVRGKHAGGLHFRQRSQVSPFVTGMTLMMLLLFWIVVIVMALYAPSVRLMLVKENGKWFWLITFLFLSLGGTSLLVGFLLKSDSWWTNFAVSFGSATLTGLAMFVVLFYNLVQTDGFNLWNANTVIRAFAKKRTYPYVGYHLVGKDRPFFAQEYVLSFIPGHPYFASKRWHRGSIDIEAQRSGDVWMREWFQMDKSQNGLVPLRSIPIRSLSAAYKYGFGTPVLGSSDDPLAVQYRTGAKQEQKAKLFQRSLVVNTTQVGINTTFSFGTKTTYTIKASQWSALLKRHTVPTTPVRDSWTMGWTVRSNFYEPAYSARRMSWVAAVQQILKRPFASIEGSLFVSTTAIDQSRRFTPLFYPVRTFLGSMEQWRENGVVRQNADYTIFDDKAVEEWR